MGQFDEPHSAEPDIRFVNNGQSVGRTILLSRNGRRRYPNLGAEGRQKETPGTSSLTQQAAIWPKLAADSPARDDGQKK
jgi:hypothetical protein